MEIQNVGLKAAVLGNLEKILELSMRNGDSLTASSANLGFGKNYFYQGLDRLLKKRSNVTSREFKLLNNYFQFISLDRIKEATQANFSGNPDNILIIGDTHFPFTRQGYLEHCFDMAVKYDCGKIVHIGDVIDNHYSSYHETDPDGFSAGQELERVICMASDWKKVFPSVDVTIGNHDTIVMRKAFSSGLSKQWIKDFNEVLELQGWIFHTNLNIHGVHFTHGTGTGGGRNAAMNRAMQLRTPCVQGHFHTTSGIEWNVSKKDRIFGLQVGCGVDDEAYAFAYAKDNPKKFIISCAVILDKGKIPIVLPMEL